MYNLSMILDKSKNPKLSGTKVGHIIWMVMSSVTIFLSIVPTVIGREIGAVLIIMGFISLICSIIALIASNKSFKKKNLIHGSVELTRFNGKEVGLFKSNYNELIMIDFENIIRTGTKSFSNSFGKRGVYIKNKNTTVMYGGALVKCAIALDVKDQGLVNYLINRGYVDEDDFEVEIDDD